MKKVALVACVKAKRDEPSPASRLYDSTWFRKARAYAEAKADTWRILSAKHGALHPGEVIDLYRYEDPDTTEKGDANTRKSTQK